MDEDTKARIAIHIAALLELVGEDPLRPGLVETPNRVAKAYATWFGGYDKDPASVLKVFSDGAPAKPSLVVERDIPFWSHCEHHMAPFFGTVDIVVINNGRITGISKFKRLVDVYARRLQVQERLTDQIGKALNRHLEPLGVFVRVTARHSCMESRGVETQGTNTVTTYASGQLDVAADNSFVRQMELALK